MGEASVGQILKLMVYKSQKFLQMEQVHVGMEPSKTSQTEWEQHYNTGWGLRTRLTHLHHPYILCYFANYVLCLLVV